MRLKFFLLHSKFKIYKRINIVANSRFILNLKRKTNKFHILKFRIVWKAKTHLGKEKEDEEEAVDRKTRRINFFELDWNTLFSFFVLKILPTHRIEEMKSRVCNLNRVFYVFGLMGFWPNIGPIYITWYCRKRFPFFLGVNTVIIIIMIFKL